MRTRILFAALLGLVGASGSGAPVRVEDQGLGIFRRLHPPSAALVVSVPRTQYAGQRWRRVVSPAVLPNPDIQRLRAAVANIVASLFSVELVGVAPASPSATPAWILIGRVQDERALADALERLERTLVDRAASAMNPVTRSVESIGDARIVVLTDSAASPGYLTHGPGGVCVLSTDVAELRRIARLLASSGGEEPPAGSLERAAAADLSAFSASPARPDARFLLRTAEATIVGNVYIETERIDIRSVTHYAPEAVSLAARLYARAAASPQCALTGLRAASPEALVVVGGCVVYADALAGYLGQLAQVALERLPEPTDSGLNAASARARRRVESVVRIARDAAALKALGPEAYLSLETLDFRKPGRFPSIALLAACQARDEPPLRQALETMERSIAEYVSDLLTRRAAPHASASPLPPNVTVLAAPSPTPKPVATRNAGETSASRLATPSVARFVSAPPPGAASPMRMLDTPGVTLPLQPTWALCDGYLMIGSPPEAVSQARMRLALPGSAAEVDRLQTLAEQAGLGPIHAYLVARPGHDSQTAAAILDAWAQRIGATDGGVSWAGSLLRAVDRLTAVRTALTGGATRTFCRVEFKRHE